jgi:thiamine-phosphate pyrophosphorylase
MNTPRRIIDANANRAREAMRVLEEAARFLVEDAKLSQELKQMRHAFTQVISPLEDLIIDRDTPGDIGTRITTDAEQVRQDTRAVVLAAGSRLAEALRAIEEYGKVQANYTDQQAKLVVTCEKLRYQSYDVTKRLSLTMGNGKRQQRRLCLLLTQSLCTQCDWREVLQQAIEHGVDCVQVREKDMDSGPLLDHIRDVIAQADRRASVIVNDRPDLALLAEADGVHLGQTDLGVLEARKLLGSRMTIGVSTSNLDQAKQAKANGADYCGVGPMFPTTTKHKPDIAGPSYLHDFLAWDGLPHLAIGGITPNNIGELADVGCRGVAVSSAICSAQNPGTVAAALSNALQAVAGTS